MKCKSCGSMFSEVELDHGKCPYCGEVIEKEESVKVQMQNPSGRTEDRTYITSEVIERVKPACVRVETERGLGSGFINEDGFVVTNAHVVNVSEDEDKMVCGNTIKAIFVGKEDEKHLLELVAYSVLDDIAILRFVKEPKDMHRVKLGNNNEVHMGDRVFTIGNPNGWGFAYIEGSVAYPLNDNIKPGANKVVYLSMIVNTGNSGGPVFNSKGEVIGIVTFYRLKSDGISQVYGVDENTGRPVPINAFVQGMQHVKDLSFAVSASTISEYVELAKQKLKGAR